MMRIHVTNAPMVFAFDLDGTLCHTVDGDYYASTPFEERIAIVNRLHRAGNHVIIHTARGQASSKNVRAEILRMTERQLERWGLRYNELLEKPFAHVYVDDRGSGPTAFFEDPDTVIAAAHLIGGGGTDG